MIRQCIKLLLLLPAAAQAQSEFLQLNLASGASELFEISAFSQWNPQICALEVNLQHEPMNLCTMVPLDQSCPDSACDWYIELDGLFYGPVNSAMAITPGTAILNENILENCLRPNGFPPPFSFLQVLQPNQDPVYLDRDFGLSFDTSDNERIWVMQTFNGEVACDNPVPDPRLDPPPPPRPAPCDISLPDNVFCDGFELTQ